MKSSLFAIIASVGTALVAPASAATTVLDFNAAQACVGGCSDYTPISQAYGDSALVDVTYTARTGIGNTAASGTVNYWGPGYSGLPSVAWSGFNSASVTEIKLEPLGGSVLTLNSFRLGSYLDFSRTVTVSLFDLSYNPIISFGTTPGVSPWGNTFIGFSTTSGYILQIGPDGYNGGITNLSFAANAVPEPANWLMLIAGFGLTGAAMRGRRTHATA